MLEQCRRQNAEFATRRAWLERVREQLAQRLASPPGLEELARAMNCSARSLRRHLAQQQTSYQQLLDDLRFARAKELLQQGELPIYRIAEELGFSETASLRHAFQRWSGQPPASSAAEPRRRPTRGGWRFSHPPWSPNRVEPTRNAWVGRAVLRFSPPLPFPAAHIGCVRIVFSGPLRGVTYGRVRSRNPVILANAGIQ